jgi:hypothetical protein
MRGVRSSNHNRREHNYSEPTQPLIVCHNHGVCGIPKGWNNTYI